MNLCETKICFTASVIILIFCYYVLTLLLKVSSDAILLLKLKDLVVLQHLIVFLEKAFCFNFTRQY